jgi:lipoyl(octanoyl) transferase
MRYFDNSVVQWVTSQGLIDYPFAVSAMERRAAQIRASGAPELVWLLEHPPLYTAGTSARAADLTQGDRLPVFATGRGGQYTYHGPGQRVVYVMLDVHRRFGTDVRRFVAALEGWIVDALARLGVEADVRPGRIGVWVGSGPEEKKIAALGIRIRNGVSFHGISLNVAPDLSHYEGIVPCGISEFGVTSLADLGSPASMKDVDMSLKAAFMAAFGPAMEASATAIEPGNPHPAASERS